MTKNCKYIFFIFNIVIILLSIEHHLFAQEYSLFQLNDIIERTLREGISEGNDTKIREGLKIAHELLDSNPDYYDILRKVVIAHYILGEYNLVRFYLDKGLRLKRIDNSLQLLNVLLLLKEQDLNAVYDQLLVLTQQDPNNVHVLYVELIYYVSLGDKINIRRVLDEIALKYGKEHSYLNIYNTVLAIVHGTESVEQDVIIDQMKMQYKKDMWIQWLIANYYFSIGKNDDTLIYTNFLKKTKVAFLSQYAFEQEYKIAYNANRFEQAKTIAEEYTERYPTIYASWVQLGIAYYKQDNYVYAERAFNRALALVPNMEFIQFMYDTVVREDVPTLVNVRQKRIVQLHALGTQALNSGNISIANEYFQRVLYINPLDYQARRSIVTLLEREEKYKEAARELEILIKNGYREENIDFILSSFYRKIQTGNNNRLKIPQTYRSLPVTVWNIELGEVSYDNSIDIDFRRKTLEYYASKSNVVNWSTSHNDALTTYVVKINFFNLGNNIVARIKLYDKTSQSFLLDFEEIDVGKQYFVRLANNIIKKIDDIMPKIFPIVSYDKIGEQVLIDVLYEGLETGKSYDIFQNIQSLDFSLSSLPQTHYSVSQHPIGTLTIDTILGYYAIGTLVKPIAEESQNITNERFQYLQMVDSLKVGDFIIFSSFWDDYLHNSELFQSEKGKETQRKIRYYLLQLVFVDFLL